MTTIDIKLSNRFRVAFYEGNSLTKKIPCSSSLGLHIIKLSKIDVPVFVAKLGIIVPQKILITLEDDVNNRVTNAIDYLSTLDTNFTLGIEYLGQQGQILRSVFFQECVLNYVEHGSLDYSSPTKLIVKIEISWGKFLAKIST